MPDKQSRNTKQPYDIEKKANWLYLTSISYIIVCQLIYFEYWYRGGEDERKIMFATVRFNIAKFLCEMKCDECKENEQSAENEKEKIYNHRKTIIQMVI